MMHHDGVVVVVLVQDQERAQQAGAGAADADDGAPVADHRHAAAGEWWEGPLAVPTTLNSVMTTTVGR